MLQIAERNLRVIGLKLGATLTEADLARWMIDIGVTTTRSLDLKQLDGAYFQEDV